PPRPRPSARAPNGGRAVRSRRFTGPDDPARVPGRSGREHGGGGRGPDRLRRGHDRDDAGLTLFATVGGYQIRSRRAARDRGAGAGWNLVTAAPGSGDT